MSCYQTRKILRQLESARLFECPVQRAEQLPLSAKFLSATRTGFHMTLEYFQGRIVQLAIKISGDIFDALVACRESLHEIPTYA